MFPHNVKDLKWQKNYILMYEIIQTSFLTQEIILFKIKNGLDFICNFY